MCAKEFGWTKDIIENLPVEYLRGLLYIHKKSNEKPLNIPPAPKPKFK
jgi:hypothetical protein